MKKQNTSLTQSPFVTTIGEIETGTDLLMPNELKQPVSYQRAAQFDIETPTLRSLERRMRRSRRMA